MKLCKEMVEGMGGAGSEGYNKFKNLCCTAYNILRKSADLILNLFILMVDENINDIVVGTVDPMKNIMKVCYFHIWYINGTLIGTREIPVGFE